MNSDSAQLEPKEAPPQSPPPIRPSRVVASRQALRRLLAGLVDPKHGGRRLAIGAGIAALSIGIELAAPRLGVSGLAGAPGFYALVGLAIGAGLAAAAGVLRPVLRQRAMDAPLIVSAPLDPAPEPPAKPPLGSAAP